MDKIKNYIMKNNDAIINIDVIFAIALFIGVIMVASQIMPTISHEDRDWRIKQYMAAVRTTDILVQDEGEPGWEIELKNGNFSNVTKIGLVHVDDNRSVKKVLDIEKIEVLVLKGMGEEYVDNSTNTAWWEFPSADANLTTRDNLVRILGLSGYNFYIQLHPVGLTCSGSSNSFDSIPLQINLSNKPINFDTVSIVDRYVYIFDPHITDKTNYLSYCNKAIHYRLNVWVW